MLWSEMLRVESESAALSKALFVTAVLSAFGVYVIDAPAIAWSVPVGFLGGALFLKAFVYFAITKPLDTPLKVTR